MKIEFIELEGRIYPLAFSLNTVNEITKRYRNLNAMYYMLENEKTPLSRKTDVLCNVLSTMIYSGCQYYNVFRKQPYEKAPIDDEGKFIPLSAEQITLVFEPTEEKIRELTYKIEKCFGTSAKKELTAKVKNNTKKKKKR